MSYRLVCHKCGTLLEDCQPHQVSLDGTWAVEYCDACYDAWLEQKAEGKEPSR